MSRRERRQGQTSDLDTLAAAASRFEVAGASAIEEGAASAIEETPSSEVQNYDKLDREIAKKIVKTKLKEILRNSGREEELDLIDKIEDDEFELYYEMFILFDNPEKNAFHYFLQNSSFENLRKLLFHKKYGEYDIKRPNGRKKELRGIFEKIGGGKTKIAVPGFFIHQQAHRIVISINRSDINLGLKELEKIIFLELLQDTLQNIMDIKKDKISECKKFMTERLNRESKSPSLSKIDWKKENEKQGPESISEKQGKGKRKPFQKRRREITRFGALQEKYDDLEEEYANLQARHETFLKQIDDLIKENRELKDLLVKRQTSQKGNTSQVSGGKRKRRRTDSTPTPSNPNPSETNAEGVGAHFTSPPERIY